MEAEFSALVHNETVGEEWRAAFSLAVANNTKQLKQDRLAQVRRRIYLDLRTFVVKDMTDAQIEEVARVLAARDCERGINEQKAAELRSKARAGVAA